MFIFNHTQIHKLLSISKFGRTRPPHSVEFVWAAFPVRGPPGRNQRLTNKEPDVIIELSRTIENGPGLSAFLHFF